MIQIMLLLLKKEKAMTIQREKARRSGQLGVIHVAGRLALALGIAVIMYLLVYRPQQLH